jgi:hypothetical protein
MSVARSRALAAFVNRIRQWAAEGRADLLLGEAARLQAQAGAGAGAAGSTAPESAG